MSSVREQIERAIQVTADAMVRNALPQRLMRRGGFWHFTRRVPQQYAELDRRVIVQHSTNVSVNDDRRGERAKIIADDLDAALEHYWRDLANGNTEAANTYKAAKKAAQAKAARPSLPATPRGFVYFIECGDYIKVGYTGSVRARLTNLAMANPYPLKVLATMEGSKQTESSLHDRFADAFHRGEWFRKTPELLAFIDQIAGRAAA
jgi:Meiotically up-regulated gene 113